MHYFSSGEINTETKLDWHSHHGTELVYVRQGFCEHLYKNSAIPDHRARAGTVIVNPPGEEHTSFIEKQSTINYVIMDIVASDVDDSARLIEVGSDSLLPKWFREVSYLAQNFDMETAAHLGEAIWSHLAALESRSQFRKSVHPAVWRAVEFFNESYDKSFNVSEIARQAGVSPNHLNSLFQQTFQYGPSQYLQRLRLAHVIELLGEPNLSVAEIAPRCGFSDQNYLSRKFRDYYGMSPSEYRKRYLKNGCRPALPPLLRKTSIQSLLDPVKESQ